MMIFAYWFGTLGGWVPIPPPHPDGSPARLFEQLVTCLIAVAAVLVVLNVFVDKLEAR